MSALWVDRLAKRYGRVQAVAEVSFRVEPGEIYGLLGPNGAGKTTALECIVGLRKPDTGRVTASGPFGVQLQAASLQEKITPRQALELFGAFYPDAYACGELLSRFGLAHRAGAHFDTLSGGERQRLFLALAIVNRPAIVVLDEPAAGLDPAGRRELGRLIRELRDEGRAVVMSTHDVEDAGEWCGRVAILDGGRIVAEAPPAELIARVSAPSRLTVETAPALTPDALAALPGVISAVESGRGWRIETAAPGGTLAAIARDAELLHVELRRPTLEDAFLQLTGRGWPR